MSWSIRAAVLALCLGGLGWACEAPKAPAPAQKVSAPAPAPAQEVSARSAFEAPAPETVPDLEYIEFVTGKRQDEMPMVVMVHGLGDSPEGMKGLFTTYTASVRIILPRGPLPYSGGHSWFDVVKPIKAGDPKMVEGMIRSAAALDKLIEKLLVKYKTKGKPVVAGFSQGGALSFVVAVRHPEAVRAAIPVSGWLPTGLLPRPGAEVAPIRALHGGADTLVELDPTNEAVASLVDRGADASIEVFPRVGHAFTRQMQVSFFNLLRRAMSETDSSVEP